MNPPDTDDGPADDLPRDGSTSSNAGENDDSSGREIINISQSPLIVDAGNATLHLRHMSLNDMAHYEAWVPEEDRTAREVAVHVLEWQTDEEATPSSVSVGSLSDEELRQGLTTWVSEAMHTEIGETATLDEAVDGFEIRLEEERQKIKEHTKAIFSSVADVRTSLPLQSALDDLRQVVTGADWMVRLTDLQKEMNHWEGLHTHIRELSELAGQINRASMFPLASLGKELKQYGNIVEGLQLPNLAPKLTQQLVSPVQYYSEFARNTIGRIEAESTALRRGALMDSLALADAQITDTMNMVERLLQQPLADIETAHPQRYNLFQRQQTELLEAEPSQAGEATRLDDLHRLSGSARVSRRSRDLFKQCLRCNENARMRGDEDVFRPTNQFLAKAVAVPFQISRDAGDLGDLVDALYVALYEAAGTDNLRYLVRGYVEDEECGVVWRVKWLRNHWLRHDPEHGSPSSQRRKYKKLKQTLQEYGLEEKPQDPDAFEQLHRRLVEDACDFVQLVAERIKQT